MSALDDIEGLHYSGIDNITPTNINLTFSPTAVNEQTEPAQSIGLFEAIPAQPAGLEG